MNILSPSILSADFTILGDELRCIDEAGSEYIHIDVMDGIFVPSISYGMPVIKSIRKATKKVFDVHLMITEPERYINEFVESGADIITFHVEATKDPDKVIDMIHEKGLKAGVSVKPKTPLSEIEPYLEKMDMLLILPAGWISLASVMIGNRKEWQISICHWRLFMYPLMVSMKKDLQLRI